MAVTIDDVVLDGTWQNAYALSGISVGSAMNIQNKSPWVMLSVIAATAPDETYTSGVLVTSYQMAYIDSGEVGVFIKGMPGAKVSIQWG